jgi:hypothetical protein
MHSYANR